MKNLIKCLGLFLVTLFAALPAVAGTQVILNAGDRIYENGYILATPDTPVIINGVIIFPNSQLTNTYITTEPPGVVAPRLTNLVPGASYVMYRGVPYQAAAARIPWYATTPP